MIGELYLVATPIGNLEDITLRAINTLKQVDLIVAEDTRHTLKLLNHLNISKTLISYHRHSNKEKEDEIINKLLQGNNIALVSDAGTPVISDPGDNIVIRAIQNNINVISIPGPCAAITAIIASGLDANEFTFLGFLPLNSKLRKEKLLEIENTNKTIIIYEAPHKLMNTLNQLKEILGNRCLVIARELTKVHEEFIRGNIKQILSNEITLKGEFVIIIEKNNNIQTEQSKWSSVSIQEHYKYYQDKQMKKNDILKQMSLDRKLSKNEIYKILLNKKK